MPHIEDDLQVALDVLADDCSEEEAAWALGVLELVSLSRPHSNHTRVFDMSSSGFYQGGLPRSLSGAARYAAGYSTTKSAAVVSERSSFSMSLFCRDASGSTCHGRVEK